ncbi:hypothetical protein C9374_007320 [Naegleria lovaniensis]|uniref:Ubiquitin carboxyl-terminal hydrolase 7 ICP0-binding domain-containing protein n=1 Tax=Naegleria lovaniensis TaxID=51637 RepID=A0AA88KIF9_NAELO|nr:uncharacterized protein C9374_007320 [Naegleria lovaniensis]KAG2379181.1 hypothetical protein C9374_007320 [Naegleria lovaniensis]
MDTPITSIPMVSDTSVAPLQSSHYHTELTNINNFNHSDANNSKPKAGPLKALDESKIKVITEKHLVRHHSYEIFDFGLVDPIGSFNESSIPITLLKELIYNKHKIQPENQKLWLFVTRTNGTYRPFDTLDKEYFDHFFYEREYAIFVEQVASQQPPATKHISIFVKYYDIDTQQLLFCGHASLEADKTFLECMSSFSEMCQTKLNVICNDFDIYEEVFPSRIDLCTLTHRLGHEAELIDGDILILQRKIHTKFDNSQIMLQIPTIIWEYIKKDKYLIKSKDDDHVDEDLPTTSFDVNWYYRLLSRFDQYLVGCLASDNHTTLVKELLKVRLDWLGVSQEFPIFIKYRLKQPILSILAENNCIQTAQMLLKEFKANVNVSCKRRTKSNGVYYSINSLYWAAEKGHLEMVQLLLNHGSHKISSPKNNRHTDSKLVALEHHHYDVARYLEMFTYSNYLLKRHFIKPPDQRLSDIVIFTNTGTHD